MKDYLKGFIFGFLLLFIGLATIYWADQEGYFLLKTVNFSSQAQEKFSETKIYKKFEEQVAEALAAYKDKSLLSINMKALTHDLNKMEWVDSIYARRSFPNRLHVEIKPKKWIAYYREDEGFKPITDSGEILKQVNILEGPNLPIVDLSQKKWHAIKGEVISLIESLPENGFINQSTVQELASDKEGLYLMVSPDNLMVRLGSEDFSLRLARSERVMEYLYQRNLQGRVINASFTQKVVVKLRKAR